LIGRFHSLGVWPTLSLLKWQKITTTFLLPCRPWVSVSTPSTCHCIPDTETFERSRCQYRNCFTLHCTLGHVCSFRVSLHFSHTGPCFSGHAIRHQIERHVCRFVGVGVACASGVVMLVSIDEGFRVHDVWGAVSNVSSNVSWKPSMSSPVMQHSV
jgi:hypothetical protein